MNELIFKISFVILWILYILIRVPFDKMHNQTEKNKAIHSSTEKILLGILGIAFMLLPMLWVFTSLLNSFNLELPIWLRIAGIILAILSLVYFYYIHKSLGANWSPTLELKTEHQLIKSGPYKYIRHPMYAQMWIWSIAQIFILSNSISGFSGIIGCAILYFIRVPKEEKMMTDRFGAEYTKYMKETGRVLPKIGRLSS